MIGYVPNILQRYQVIDIIMMIMMITMMMLTMVLMMTIMAVMSNMFLMGHWERQVVATSPHKTEFTDTANTTVCSILLFLPNKLASLKAKLVQNYK